MDSVSELSDGNKCKNSNSNKEQEHPKRSSGRVVCSCAIICSYLVLRPKGDGRTI